MPYSILLEFELQLIQLFAVFEHFKQKYEHDKHPVPELYEPSKHRQLLFTRILIIEQLVQLVAEPEHSRHKFEQI